MDYLQIAGKQIMDAFILTNIGKVRERNEDSIGMLQNGNRLLLAIADGISKPQNGKIASQLLIDKILELTLPSPTDLFRADEYIHVRNKIIEANNDILKKKQRMGTTIIVLYFQPRKLNFIWAGDSRGYVFRNSKLERITIDDSKIERTIQEGHLTREESLDPSLNAGRGSLTKYVGKNHIIKGQEEYINVNYILPESGDLFLICSDGLTNMLLDREIEKILIDNFNSSSKEICERLENEALEKGATDNVSIGILKLLTKKYSE